MNHFDFENLPWTQDAQLKLKNIPYFVRRQARQKIEDLARSQDLEMITADLVEQARIQLGQ